MANVGSWLKAAILANRWLANRRIPVLALPPLTFGLVIAAGSLLLWMPGMQRGKGDFLDAAFTATSAICVTGLSTIDVSAALSPVGKTLLAILIQIGGIGTLTVMGMLALWTSGMLSIGERAAFSELLGGSQLADTRRIVATTIKATLTIEFVGAVLLWLAFRGKVAHPLLFGIFHAISAFCNAGFSLFSDSLAGFSTDIPLLSIVMLLIFAGSLGFPALSNLWRVGVTRLIPWAKSEPIARETRFSLRASLALIVAGTMAIMADSWIGGKGRSLLEALFQSVTLRTAGFQVESQLSFGALGTWLGIAFMAIGASPQSTGGGMKTTVAARLFLRLDSQEQGQPRRPFFKTQAFRIALLLVGLYLAIATGAGALIALIDGVGLTDAFYESFSALGTVGLSRDLTPSLSLPARLIVMLLMFTGRVLYPTLAVGIIRKRRTAPGDADWA
jgi:trk system potassium uptake protein